MTTSRKSHTKGSKVDGEQDLADLKFKYDLLTNELFHLREFISLVDYDPTHFNDSESFHKFLKDTHLSLEEGREEPTNGLEDTIIAANLTHRRRNLRTSTVVSSDAINEKKDDIELKLETIAPLVRNKCEELKSKLNDNSSIKHVVPQKRPILHSKKREAPKASKLKTEKKEEISLSLVNKDEQKHNHIAKVEETSENFTINYASDSSDNASEHYSDNFYFTTSSEEEDIKKKRGRKRKRPRINLTVHPPKQTITNPSHVIKPEYKNLHEYMNSFKSLEEDLTLDEYNQYIDEQKQMLLRIKKGIESGTLKYDKETDSLQPLTSKEIKIILAYKPDPISYFYKQQNLQVHRDHLINQGVHMSKLFRNSTKARIARAKKVSQMIEQHFKHIAGAEERKLKEEERHKKGLARFAVQAVKKRWNMAEKAYRILRKDEEEQLKRIEGKQHLSKMLEKSTQLLGAQLNQTNEDGKEGNLSSNSDDISSESDIGMDDELSTSSSDDEEVGADIELDNNNQASTEATPTDESLNLTQLKEKYEHLNGSSTVYDSSNADGKSPLLDEHDDANSESSVMTGEETSENSSSENESQKETEDRSDDRTPSVGLSALFGKGEESNEELDLDDSEDFATNNSSSAESEEVDQRDEADNLGSNADNVEKVEHTETGDGTDVNDVEEEVPKKIEEEQLSVVDVPVPSLLRGNLRTYQKQGLNWLASLYNNQTNGILADEMGLGKTIQTISLLAYLACEKENWGPHLIVVPTSVLLNWEMEFKRFAPGFKVLTYYGSPQQRKEKRKGWNKPDAFHVCIVSYQLVVQDQHSFKRKRWQYMVLDEAHNIKNFRSTRWQALLNFNTQRRLLLTGTPLQNNLAELWSLLYFLMPQTVIDGKKVSGFADLEAFQQWFGRPVDKIIETGQGFGQDKETKKTVAKLHQVLRPYLLRRLKADVEKQMPAKYEHIVYCKLSKRQRFLYDDFMSRAQTKATLASGNFMSIVNCLMQLRKVCNHPNLFEVRPILTSFVLDHCVASDYTSIEKTVVDLFEKSKQFKQIDLDFMNLVFANNDHDLTSYHAEEISKLKCVNDFIEEVDKLKETNKQLQKEYENTSLNFQDANQYFQYSKQRKVEGTLGMLNFLKMVNRLRCDRRPIFGKNLIELLTKDDMIGYEKPRIIDDGLIKPLQTRLLDNKKIIDTFAVLTPNAVSLDMRKLTLGLNDDSLLDDNTKSEVVENCFGVANPLHQLQTKLTIAFPDKSLLQYDCGKLQKLAIILQQLKDNGHRALIFTQMTKVLDVLEQFLNYHGYLYMRLDGATKIEDRQILTERFNTDSRTTVFILSSRSGGLGINLTGADTVIFYDSDWNPAMDKQCQDRCHRIGQTRDVHIYRFVSEHTIESNILKKANQKRQLDNVVIQEGDFTTDYFSKLSVRDLLGSELPGNAPNEDKPLIADAGMAAEDPKQLEKLLAQAEDEDDVKAANLAMREVEIDNEDFDETAGRAADEQEEEEVAEVDEYEGTAHVDEYMIRFIANGHYY
ncbi:chromatin-remodeling protein SWR1 [Saccharomyces eubayanus]|uniref:chromatin-remodeling protein SWR1 n=1 Tax=Saccharomyces eubayanus TaxID=1080349 RepID=UPI0006C5175B|nr:SWR1-like protein [Saccharomyces eubayanus]KOH01161.1 SWR1-like protein [Saccharomyces eubayanus]